jgi:hypothetical protein
MQINIAEGVDIDAQRIMTGRCCVIGQSGSGKSFLIGVFAEELAKAHLPFLIIDTEGEYVNLGKAYNLLVAGNGPEANVGLDANYELLFRQSIQAKKPIVMDVSDSIDQQQVVYDAIKALYSVEEQLRSPYLVIIEEADKFVPQVVKRRINIIEEVSVRGRKRGIGLMVATQRPANISKNVLAQCSYGFIGRLTIENDFDSISILLENRKRMEEVARLGTGEFMPFGLGRDEVFKVKNRSVSHSGSTPSIDYNANTDVSIESIIAQLSNTKQSSSKQAKTHSKDTLTVKPQSEKIEVITGIHPREELEQKLKGSKSTITKLMHKNNYSIESLDTIYVPLVLIKLLVPVGKGSDYTELEAIYDNNMREVSIDKGVKLLSHAPQKIQRISEKELALLEVLRRLKRSKSERLAKECAMDITAVEKMLISLEGNSLVEYDGKYYVPKPIPKRRLKIPETLERDADGEVISLDIRDIHKLVENRYPGCKLESYSVFYMPFYKAILRRNNRLKVALFNSMSLKEEKVSRFPELAKL